MLTKFETKSARVKGEQAMCKGHFINWSEGENIFKKQSL